VLAGDFAGDRKFRDSFIETVGEDKRIVRLGYVDGRKKSELMSNAYCVVFPGKIEGSPVAVLEAMSYGNCCVASDIAEHLEIMHGFGYTFKMGDRNDLRWLLSRLLSQKRMVNSNKKAAQMYVRQNHDWDEVIDSYENLYVSLMHKIGESVS
jgi:glycosyltransferase involved in cell wall biosynthesis